MSKETVEQWITELMGDLPKEEPLKLPEEPAHKHGYLWSQCVRMLGDRDRVDAFGKWMTGQTMTWNGITGETVVFPDDFERYMMGQRHIYD